VVEATNATGLKLGGAWLNVSRFHPLELPVQGAHIRAQIDSRGYLQSVEVLDAARAQTGVRDARERRIARLAVLKAAAAFGASRPDLKSSDVLRIADSWLAWVEQD
jgi:hypothetical protein